MLKKNSISSPRVPHEIGLDDRLIDKLYIEEGNRIDLKVVGIPDYLNGLILRYSPKTQKFERKIIKY